MRDVVEDESAQLSALRGLLPDVRAVLAYVQGLERAPGPVASAYLHAHLGFWRLRWAMRTDTGPGRQHNEDGCFAWPDARAFVVLDGMGGHRSGDIAVQLAHDGLASVLEQGALSAHDPPRDAPVACLMHEAVHAANLNIIREVAASPSLRGQGATVVGWIVDRQHASVVHAGDARAYRLRRGRLEPMTRDHRLIDELVAAGKGTREALEASPLRNVVVRALGYQDDLTLGWSRVALEQGDVWLLCSDGLHDTLDDARIEALLRAHAAAPVQARCDALVDAAIEAQSRDNITAIVVEVA